MDNYFNYFTEIEEHFRRRRGGAMLLSTLDWALIETWKDAGLPLEAVLRGIDIVFDRYDQRSSKTTAKARKINGLAFCTQEVLQAAEEMKEAAVGARPPETESEGKGNAGFSSQEIQAFLARSASAIEAVRSGELAAGVIGQVAVTLRKLAEDLANRQALPLQEIEHNLTALEEKLCAALLTATPHEEMVACKAEVDREIAPYRRKMQAAQIEQLHRQYLQRRLFEKAGIPRLSLFYM